MDLKKDPMTTTLLDQHDSLYHILNLILIPTGKQSYHPSARKPFFIPNVVHHRKPQLDTTKDQQIMGSLAPRIQLQRNSWIYGSGNIIEEGEEIL